MPSGAMTLVEAAKYGDNMLKRGVIQTLIQESPLLEQTPFTPFAGNAIEVDIEGTLPDVEFRKVNETYSRSWGTDTKRFFGVSILGGEVFIDNYNLKVAANKASLKAKQYTKFAKAMSRTFDKYFFDGDGSDDSFLGVNALITEGLGMSELMASGGGALTLDKLDEVMDLFRGQSRPDAALVNRFHRRKVTNLARTSVTGISLIDVGTDVFGRKVNMYDDVPFRIIGDDKSGNAILDFDEDPGDATSDTSSLYLIAFGEDENVSGLAGAGGSMDVVDFGETEAAPGHLGRVEWYPGIAIYNPFSIVRLYGILAS